MKPIGILYATREGQARKIAEYIAARLREQGLQTDVMNLADRPDVELNRYAAAVIAASVHSGKHETEIRRFVRRHVAQLNAIPAAFVSVTLSEAGVERPSATPEERARFAADVQRVLEAFSKETGWRPKRVKPVAGALLYTKYNFLVRFIMKRIAKTTGAETDTSRDYEYTNWMALDRFADELARDFIRGAA
jgi:menaquinone-dependent protoporphyrinogen oxidase